MTKEEVKEQLPEVKVKFAGHVYKGRVAGRKEDFASVWFKYQGINLSGTWSWDSVARAVSNNKPLVY